MSDKKKKLKVQNKQNAHYQKEIDLRLKVNEQREKTEDLMKKLQRIKHSHEVIDGIKETKIKNKMEKEWNKQQYNN